MSIDRSKHTLRLHAFDGTLDKKRLRVTYSNGIFVVELSQSNCTDFKKYGIGRHVITAMYDAQANIRAKLPASKLEEVIEAQVEVFGKVSICERPEDYLDKWVSSNPGKNIVSNKSRGVISLYAMRYPQYFTPNLAVASGSGTSTSAAYNNLNDELYQHYHRRR